jgi:putative nucleotidyltransferase with HDIG domain
LNLMIKKIPVEKLERGMYIHDLGCSWMDHPFLRDSFLISTPEDVRKLRNTDICELYIDTERGKDVPQEPAAKEVRQDTRTHTDVAEDKSQAPLQVSVFEERARARRIHSHAKQVITNIMHEVRVGRQIELEPVKNAVAPLVSSILRNKDALLGLTRIRHKDKYTFEHSVSVAVLLVSFAKEMELDRDSVIKIGIGGLLHDIGKTRVPNQILNKPGKLTEEEFVIMRGHVVHSREILEQTSGIDPVPLAVAADHHERYDGSGYPNGKEGLEIGLYGRMAAIVDVYDAMTATRVYRKAIEPHEVLRKLIEWSKFQFELELVQRFVQCVGIYPAGTLVSLASGRIAVVLASGTAGLLYPLVRIVYDAHKKKPVPPIDLDLSELPADSEERIVGAELSGAWGIDPNAYMD